MCWRWPTTTATCIPGARTRMGMISLGSKCALLGLLRRTGLERQLGLAETKSKSVLVPTLVPLALAADVKVSSVRGGKRHSFIVTSRFSPRWFERREEGADEGC